MVAAIAGRVCASIAAQPAAPDPHAQSRAHLGRLIFFDPRFSTPPGTSCASCHDPRSGYAGNHGSPNGVAAGSRPGVFAERNTPSLRYLKFVPPFFFRWEEDQPVPDPHGGFFWDGRVDDLASACQQPLLNPREMGNPDAATVVRSLTESAYAAAFRQEYGPAPSDPRVGLQQVGDALAAFLTSDEMAPFSSRYDAYLRGKGTLSAAELAGLKIFQDPARGNCNACHTLDTASADPTRSLFTDYGFEAAGLPRNRALPANADPGHFDLGLCQRTDNPLAANPALCGQFRTPTLRNVALRRFFFHNGVVRSLRDAVAFYATRDTDAARWYPGAKYDDMPEGYRVQVNTVTVPYNGQAGQPDRLTATEIDEIVAFLRTLTDREFLEPFERRSR